MPEQEGEKFIDREAEQEIFDKLLKLEDDARVLTIRDRGGRGKSELLRRLRYKCEWRDPQRAVSLIELDKLEDNEPFELVHKLVDDLRKDEPGLKFPLFAIMNEARMRKDFTPFQVSDPSGIHGEADARNAIIHGSARFAGVNLEHVATAVVNPVRRWTSPSQEVRAREVCTEAFFSDLKNECADRPAVVLFDGWEKCNKELEKWLLQKLRRHCFDLDKRPAQFVVVLAGREIPDFKDRLGEVAYKQVVRSIEALGHWEERHVKAFLELHGYHLDDDDVRFLCKRLRGGWGLDKALSVAKECEATNRG